MDSLIHDLVSESHQALVQGRVPDGVLPYLTEQRGLTEETIKLYGIGFCDVEHEKRINQAYYDMEAKRPVFPFPQHIRDKIVIPIRDDCGKLVSFATRGIGKGQSWWNFPFKKGNYLFGLDKAKSACFHKNKLVLVEGYMDQIVLFQEGLRWVGSPMGTRFTLVQIGLVLRYCERLCLCLDADRPNKNGGAGPGQRATQRILSDNDVKNNFSLTTMQLPIGEDPDEFVLHNGAASLLSLERTARVIEGNTHGEYRD